MHVPASCVVFKQFRLESIFQMNGLQFYYLKIGFLEYLRISGEIRYPSGPIGYSKKRLLIVSGGERSRHESVNHEKIALAHDHDNFDLESRTYQREAVRTTGWPSGPGRVFLRSFFNLPHTLVPAQL